MVGEAVGTPVYVYSTATLTRHYRVLAAAIGAGLVLRDCPVPGRFSIAMVWPQRHHRDVMHRWLHHQVIEAVRLPDSPPA